MKYIFSILIFVFTINSFSQDERLFDKYWYLYSLTIDNETIIPPLGQIGNHHNLQFLKNNYHNLITGICNSLSGDIDFDEFNSTFTLTGTGQTLASCILNLDRYSENRAFEPVYFGFFYDNSSYSYEIVSQEGSETLDLIGANGNKAVYSSSVLSTKRFSKFNFSILPNPVKDKLIIASANSLKNLKLQIFDFSGKIVLRKQKLDSNSINVEKLSSGIYFIRIENEHGNIGIKKFVK